MVVVYATIVGNNSINVQAKNLALSLAGTR